MPLQYTGIIAEHLHARTKAGLFDICHMGELMLGGSSSGKDLEHLVTCRISDMPVGKCRYGFLLREDGGIIDDLIVFKTAPYDYMLVVNASTIKKDSDWIKGHISATTTFEDISAATAKLDLQGPLSLTVISSLMGEETAGRLKRYRFVQDKINGVKTIVSRTGYTGEIGFELFFPVEHAEMMWDLLTGFEGVKPVGLGARDTLRLEMGYSLYGNDIDEKHNPFEANLGKFVHMDKDFLGRSALERRGRKPSSMLLTGFVCEARRSARSHFTVMADGRKAGEVTSGAFSPCLERGIGLCYMERELVRENREIVLTDGKIEIKAFIKKVPMYDRGQGCPCRPETV